MDKDKRIVNFLFEVGTMRKLMRMHRQALLTDDMSDSIASHSYRVAMIGWFLAKEEKADPYKIVMMSLLHDVEEVRSNDHNYIHKKYIKIFEKEINEDQLGDLPHHDLKDFVDHQLFPYLKKFKAEDSNTIEYKIGEIFSELKNKISSGYKLRQILNAVDDMHFRLYEEKHELSHLYESKIKNMGNAGRNGGEYYTPRPLIKTIVKVVAPEIGNKIYKIWTDNRLKKKLRTSGYKRIKSMTLKSYGRGWLKIISEARSILQKT